LLPESQILQNNGLMPAAEQSQDAKKTQEKGNHAE